MKRLHFLSITAMVVFIGLLDSCVSLQDRTMTSQERAETEVIGTVTAEFTTVQPLHIIMSNSIKNKAVSLLRAEASKKYQGNIDVKNITIGGSYSPWNIVTMLCFASPPALLNIQSLTASGDVVLYNSRTGSNQSNQRKIASAIKNTSDALIGKLPRNATIAILSVSSNDRDTAEYVIEELEYSLVNAGRFIIVDRRRLDQIRREQNFQASGEVSDKSAVSIGNMLGASIVITGDISGTGSNQRLSLKALDVKTAQIITMAREQF
ncbi:MAG: penicillin-binding protein activator LpoB [Spirochaetaceae bacterium]|jgi:hypothetical protein|nr:penicillin-binding protein activator LpoB [Spirochaetaceae bacterium]